jgi:hypothetical protein
MKSKGVSCFGNGKNPTPGPAHYNANSSLMKKNVGGTMGTSTRANNNEKIVTPGPGHFSVRP